MPQYSQANRLLQVTTPLGADVLLLDGFNGREAISQLFKFDLDLLAEQPVPLDAILGQTLTVRARNALRMRLSRFFAHHACGPKLKTQRDPLDCSIERAIVISVHP